MSVPIRQDQRAGGADVFYPETDGEPMGETETHIEEIFALRFMLKRFFRDHNDAHVASNLLVYYEEGDPSRVFCPDVFVAFGVDTSQRRVYKVWEEEQVPAVVFEVSSRATWLEDQRNKKALCARLGVAEYWLYDPEADYLDPPLQGSRLFGGAGGSYRQITADHKGHLTSEALGLTAVLQDGRIALYDVHTGERLLRPEEVDSRLVEAEAKATRDAERLAVAEAKATRDAERLAVAEAKATRDAERLAVAEAEATREAERRAEAETRAADEAERRAEAEAELEALRREVRRLRGE